MPRTARTRTRERSLPTEGAEAGVSASRQSVRSPGISRGVYDFLPRRTIAAAPKEAATLRVSSLGLRAK